jgi:putative ABC transport system ATP-binding protein
MSDIVFDLKDVSKIFGKEEDLKVHALDKVNLQLEKGEFTAIVGPSGSGKTTLLNIMSALDNPSLGEITLAGKNISNMSGGELSNFRRDHIGFVFQSYNLIPVLTVRENVEYVMNLQGVNKEERDKRVDTVLAEVGLEGKADRLPTQLSGGQQQRVAVARALVTNPDIILADEPTANLDSKTGSSLMNLMLELNKNHNVTIIYTTHDEEMMKLARKIVRLKDGKIDKIDLH